MELTRKTMMLVDTLKKDFPGVTNADVQFNDQIEWATNSMVIRLRARLLSKEGEEKRLDVGPATIWGQIWERYAPLPLLLRFPVKKRKAVIAKPMIAYPKGVEKPLEAFPDFEYLHLTTGD